MKNSDIWIKIQNISFENVVYEMVAILSRRTDLHIVLIMLLFAVLVILTLWG